MMISYFPYMEKFLDTIGIQEQKQIWCLVVFYLKETTNQPLFSHVILA